jgi:hypothetical protein
VIEETSIKAYRAILHQLGQIHAAICQWMLEHRNDEKMPPPWTAREIRAGMIKDGMSATAWKRMKELLRRKLVVQAGYGHCRITEHEAKLWTLPDHAPSKKAALQSDSRLTNKDLVRHLRDTIEVLAVELHDKSISRASAAKKLKRCLKVIAHRTLIFHKE